jgi:hypothetical protein
MKDLFKKVFSEKTSSPIFVGFGVFAIFTFIVFPGLTVASTIFNILSALLGLFTLIFVFYYLRVDKIYESMTHVEPGETELDYINPEELKPKRKTTKKKTTKPEFPMAPHHTTTEKVSNVKEKVKKPTNKNLK